MNMDWKKELPAALLAGAICGIISLAAFLVLAPADWYYALVIAVVMTGASVWKSCSDREKNEKRYKRDEHMVTEPWFYSAEGFIRTDSDKAAKFFFGETGVTSIHYKNVKPIVSFTPKDKITGRGTDRCGWLSFVVPEEKMRIVIPKENAGELSESLIKNGWE